jgi:peptidoglycan DL-endopeptidase CwlO
MPSLPALVRLVGAAVVALALNAGVPASPAVAEPSPQLTRLNRQIDAAARRLEVVIEQYNAVRDDLKTTRAQTGVLGKQIDPLRRAMDARQGQLGRLAAGEYRTGGARTLAALLSADSAEQLADRLLLVERLARKQQRAISALAAARGRYEAARHTLAVLAAQQRVQQARLAARKRQIEAEIAGLRLLRSKAYALGLRGPVPLEPGPLVPYSPGRAGEAVRFAHAQLGKGYRWAASGPDAYDCSGLTSAAWGAAGVRLPHNAARQYRAVSRISRSELRPGDLVFYYPDIHHVGIYQGDGKIIHAPRYGERVRVEDMDYAPIHGYGRPGG